MSRPKRRKKDDERLGPHEGHRVITILGERHLKCRICGALFDPKDREGLRLHVERQHVRSRRRGRAPMALGLTQTHLPAAAPPAPGSGLTRRTPDGGAVCNTCGATFGPDEKRALKFHLSTHTTAKRQPRKAKKPAAKKAG